MKKIKLKNPLFSPVYLKWKAIQAELNKQVGLNKIEKKRLERLQKEIERHYKNTTHIARHCINLLDEAIEELESIVEANKSSNKNNKR